MGRMCACAEQDRCPWVHVLGRVCVLSKIDVLGCVCWIGCLC